MESIRRIFIDIYVLLVLLLLLLLLLCFLLFWPRSLHALGSIVSLFHTLLIRQIQFSFVLISFCFLFARLSHSLLQMLNAIYWDLTRTIIHIHTMHAPVFPESRISLTLSYLLDVFPRVRKGKKNCCFFLWILNYNFTLFIRIACVLCLFLLDERAKTSILSLRWNGKSFAHTLTHAIAHKSERGKQTRFIVVVTLFLFRTKISIDTYMLMSVLFGCIT